MKNKKEIDTLTKKAGDYYIKCLILWNECIKLKKQIEKNEIVIFKAKLTKGINLSKMIEQVLYPKYIGKEIIIKAVKDE